MESHRHSIHDNLTRSFLLTAQSEVHAAEWYAPWESAGCQYMISSIRPDILFGTKCIQLVSRAVLFHVDWHIMHIPNAGLHQALHGVAKTFPGSVVNICLQFMDGIFIL